LFQQLLTLPWPASVLALQIALTTIVRRAVVCVAVVGSAQRRCLK
jgi:hypothetical protein